MGAKRLSLMRSFCETSEQRFGLSMTAIGVVAMVVDTAMRAVEDKSPASSVVFYVGAVVAVLSSIGFAWVTWRQGDSIELLTARQNNSFELFEDDDANVNAAATAGSKLAVNNAPEADNLNDGLGAFRFLGGNSFRHAQGPFKPFNPNESKLLQLDSVEPEQSTVGKDRS